MSFSLISLMLFIISLLILFIINSEVEGKRVNLALNKPAYLGNQFRKQDLPDYYPPSRAVDGSYKLSKTKGYYKYPLAAVSSDPRWFVVDLEACYKVTSVNLFTRGDCCAERTSYFSVGLLIVFNENHFIKNKLCGQYPYKTKNNKDYMLKCKNPLCVSRYVSVFVEERYVDMGIREFEVYGDKHYMSLKNYLGCFKNTSHPSQKTPTSPDRCLNYCSKNNFKYFVLKESECFFTNDPGVKVDFSLCDIKCFSNQLFCGSNLKYYSVYSSNICLNSKHMEIQCDQRSCGVDNGGCGKLNCVQENVEEFQFVGCFCEKGYERRYRSTECVDVDECGEGLSKCDSNSTDSCVNTEGSYECKCREGFNRVTRDYCQFIDPMENSTSTFALKDVKKSSKKTLAALGILFSILLSSLMTIFFFFYKSRSNKSKDQFSEAAT